MYSAISQSPLLGKAQRHPLDNRQSNGDMHMKYRIHFERDGIEDFIEISGETIEEIKLQAEAEVEVRNGCNPWSEEIMEGKPIN